MKFALAFRMKKQQEIFRFCISIHEQFFLVVIASLAVLAASQFRQEPDEPPDSDSIESGPESFEDRGWHEGPTLFDLSGTVKSKFALHAALIDPSKNLICSPISALLPLGKLVFGTERGKVRNELLDAIGYTKKKVKRRLRSLISKLKYLPGVTLSIFSTLYISQSQQLRRKFIKTTMSVFKSTCEKLDFTRPAESASVINRKVSEATNGKITKIIGAGDISPSTSLILVNAIYFSGLWKKPFKDVSVGDFHSPTGVRKVPMMKRKGEYNYVRSETLRAQIIEIPYKGNKASFVIVLPFAQNGLTLLLRQLKVAPNLLNQAMTGMTESTVLLTMPKFRIESELNLNVLYEHIGVRSIFLSDRSGLKRIVNNQKVFVSRAVQKAYIEVTEKGTEAAAATAVHLMMSAMPVMFTADRPFLFFVKADKYQLFAGIYTGQA
ncbi:hypothetical protein ABMA28_015832 [Loxostege sticticalis]|uniref:Serpin domain-containing protein n=1 Tax=Loxostege sticticalis TaxID=481309 RepID=A0ABD0TB74_LOXSC